MRVNQIAWTTICTLFFLSFFFCHSVFAMEITSEFGWREHPIYGDSRFHSGIDIAADHGAGIPAVYDGVVIYADWYEGYGKTVVLQHGDTTYTLYGHCAELYVVPGQAVKQGDVIAAVGSTGVSTGPHLHLSLIRDGQWVDPREIWSGS